MRLTGSDTAEGVARRALDVDLETPDFWEASIDLIDSDFQRWQESVTTLSLGLK